MKIKTTEIVYSVFSMTILVVVAWFTWRMAWESEFWDFNIFYSAAQSALRGENIYQAYGPHSLPFWYLPWIAWIFIPLAIIPFSAAKAVFIFLSLLCAFYVVHKISHQPKAEISPANQAWAIAMGLVMCWLLFRVGQADFLISALVVWAILLVERGKHIQAGILTPFLLFKPHVVLIFLPALALRAEKKFMVSAAISLVALSLAAWIFIPAWPTEMLRMLSESGLRAESAEDVWRQTTFASLLGWQENWSGTANLPVAGVLAVAATLSVWANRQLATVPFLALAASLFCAPRAYSYNFPLLLPAMLWVSGNSNTKTLALWLGAGVISALAGFSTEAYWVVLFVFLLSTLKGIRAKAKGFPLT
jgi:hypothetical protein